MTTTIETITDEQIQALFDEAAEADDEDQMRDCLAALRGDQIAIARCVYVIRNAEAQQ